jgi:hypothetical protein
LRRALARAELDARAERLAAEREAAVAKVVQMTPAAVAAAAEVQAPVSAPAPTAAAERVAARVIDARYASMGVVGEVDAPTLDLDAALRRRRAV